MKKTLLILLCSVLIGLGFVAYFDTHYDPEKIFFGDALNRSNRWQETIERDHAHKYVLAGGSSSRIGINPALLLQHDGIPLVNAATHAGFGAIINTELALSYLKKGDTLIVAIEPDNLTGVESHFHNYTTSGLKFLVHYSKPRDHTAHLFKPSAEHYTAILRGDATTVLIRLLKPLFSDELYRYSSDKNLTESGWMNVNHNWMKQPQAFNPAKMMPKSQLNQFGKTLLTDIRDWCARNGVRVVYSIPRVLWEEKARAYYAALALDISTIMPVLRDPALGVNSNPKEFADTVNHLNGKGATDATLELGRELREQDYWTREELRAYLHSQGYDETGRPLPPHANQNKAATLP